MKIGATKWIAIVVGSCITTLVSYVMVVQMFGLPFWWMFVLALPWGIIQGWNLDRIIKVVNTQGKESL